MRLGELIGIARELKGYSLRELEQKSGVSNPLISQIETGKVIDPGFSTVVRIVDALGFDINRAAAIVRDEVAQAELDKIAMAQIQPQPSENGK